MSPMVELGGGLLLMAAGAGAGVLMFVPEVDPDERTKLLGIVIWGPLGVFAFVDGLSRLTRGPRSLTTSLQEEARRRGNWQVETRLLRRLSAVTRTDVLGRDGARRGGAEVRITPGWGSKFVVTVDRSAGTDTPSGWIGDFYTVEEAFDAGDQAIRKSSQLWW